MIDDPALYFPLEEGSGTTAVDVAGGQNGTLDTGASWIPGKIGAGAVHLNGFGDGHISFPQVDLGTSHTVAFWFCLRDSASDADGVVFGGPSGCYALYFDAEFFYYSAGTGNYVRVAHGGLAGLRVFNHFAVVRDVGTVRFYLNGVQLGAVQFLGQTTFTLPLDTMGSYNGFVFPSEVDLDDVRLYIRPLADDDIAELYTFIPAGMVEFWGARV